MSPMVRDPSCSVYDVVLVPCYRNGFPPERVHSILHQYELNMRHQRSTFGLDLIAVRASAQTYIFLVNIVSI